MATVFIPQQPARCDRATELWMPTVDVNPAMKFGNLKIMFDMHTSRVPLDKLRVPLMRMLDEFQRDDYLVAIGDPSIIAMCAAYIGLKNNGYLRLLTWDRFEHSYICREIDLGNT